MNRKKNLQIIISILLIGQVLSYVANIPQIKILTSAEAIYANDIQSIVGGITLSDAEYKQMELINKEIDRVSVDQEKVSKVYTYLKGRNSPLASEAEYLVKMADKFDLDYRLIAAISIIESSGGINTYRPYNAWGWGGAENAYTFKSWKESIYTVSRGLGRYKEGGRITPQQIAPRYNPHTPDDWARKVTYVMSLM